MNKRIKRSAPLGASLVVLSSIVYASYGIWITLVGDDLGDFTQSVIRAVLVVVFLAPVAIYRKELSKVKWRRDAWMFMGLIVSVALISAPLFYAIKIVGVGLGTAIMYAGILLGAFLFGRILNQEQYTKDKWFSTALGLLGLWMIFSPSITIFGILALFAALVSGLASGLNMVINKKLNYSASQTTIITWLATALVNVPLAFIFNESYNEGLSNIPWIYFVLFSIASLAGSWLLISGVKLIEAGAAGVLGLLEIVFGVIFGVIFFNENPSALALMGMGFIMIAAAVPYLKDYNQQSGTLSE